MDKNTERTVDATLRAVVSFFLSPDLCPTFKICSCRAHATTQPHNKQTDRQTDFQGKVPKKKRRFPQKIKVSNSKQASQCQVKQIGLYTRSPKTSQR